MLRLENSRQGVATPSLSWPVMTLCEVHGRLNFMETAREVKCSDKLRIWHSAALLQIAIGPCANMSTSAHGLGLICSHGQVYSVGGRIEAH